MQKKQEARSTRVMGWLFLAVAILLLTVVYPNQIIIKGNEIVSSAFFPKLCAYALILLSIWFLIDGYRRPSASGESSEAKLAEETNDATKQENGIPPVVLTIGLCLTCIVAIHLFGLILTCFVFLTLSFKKGGMKTWWKPILISAIVTAVMHVVFRMLMLIVLPKGILLTMLLDMIR